MPRCPLATLLYLRNLQLNFPADESASYSHLARRGANNTFLAPIIHILSSSLIPVFSGSPAPLNTSIGTELGGSICQGGITGELGLLCRLSRAQLGMAAVPTNDADRRGVAKTPRRPIAAPADIGQAGRGTRGRRAERDNETLGRLSGQMIES
jgi:hypothetical protein